MATPTTMPQAIDNLSDALNVLEDFEKFRKKLLDGHYNSVPSIGDLDVTNRTALHGDMDRTFAVLTHYVIGTAKSVVDKVVDPNALLP